MKRFAILLCAAVLAAGIGCGSSSPSPGGTTSRGRLTLNVVWPARTRLIPQAANSIQARLASGSTSLASKLLARPAGNATSSTVTFENLPPGNATLIAAAYPNADGTGTAQAQGSAAVTIVASQTATVSVTMNSTIDHLEIAPPNPTVTAGQNLQLTMTARDTAGNVVLTAPGKVTWSSASQNIATIDNTGKLTGVAVGSSVLTVTEAESGKTAQATAQVSDQAGNGLSFLYGAGSGPKIVQFKINTDGTLTPLSSAAPTIPDKANTIVADSLGRFVYVTNNDQASSSDTIYQYRVGVDGALTSIGGANPLTTFGAYNGLVDPTGKFLYLNHSASSQPGVLRRYVINGDGTLSNGIFADPPATGVFSRGSFTLGSSGRFLYMPTTENGVGDGILQYSVNADGTLTRLSPGFVSVTGNLRPELVAATERFVYIVTMDGFSIGTVHPYQIGADGSLSALATGSAPVGDSPVVISTDPGGHFLYAVNQGGATVTQLKINADGTLTPLSPANVATGVAPSQLVFDPAGKFAYVLCNNSVISLYRVNADGTLTTISLSTPGPSSSDQLEFLVTLKH